MSPRGTINTHRLPAVPPLHALPGPRLYPPRIGLPLILSVPHAGRDYPDWLLRDACGGRPSLEPLEDPHVDRLAWRALAAGFGAVVAQAPRAAIDCNRAEDDLDPLLIDGVGPRPAGARRGLGLVPSHSARHGALWRRRLGLAEIGTRLDAVHRPYHAAIADELARMERRFGGAVLLDLHSMPPRQRGAAQIVIGDRHGSSAAGWLTTLAARIARDRGFGVALNDPFAGGHIVARHGRPQAGTHAIQVEVDRSLYCLRDGRTPGPGFERVATLFEALATGLGGALGDALVGKDEIAAE